MTEREWQPIETAPKDGSPVFLKCATRPDYGEHLMWWEKTAKRWQTWLFAPARKVIGWWDEAAEPPTHWRSAK
jgi:hypothetical protein